MHLSRLQRRGVTLVELMVVVTIVAVLAALGSIAYGRYIKTGKIKRLEQLALDVSSGQERYRSRNNFYFPGDGAELPYEGNEEKFSNLLDFNTTVIPGIEIDVDAWEDGGTCDICDGAVADLTRQGFAVRVRQDLNPGGAMTTVTVTNTSPAPILTNEGE